MPPALEDSGIRAILLDIEGTTTPIDFVFRTLFPYARQRLEGFLLAHGNDPGVRQELQALRAQHAADVAAGLGPPAWGGDSPHAELKSAAAYGVWLIDRDSKCSPLKSLEGKIWQEGYRHGELHGEVYPDVPPAFERWSGQGRAIAIYSSGSILAQKLLFSTTAGGDLTRFFRAHFDTITGPKQDAASYQKISRALGIEPKNILFVSDVEGELDAALQAGMRTALCVRGASPSPRQNEYRVIRSFSEIV